MHSDDKYFPEAYKVYMNLIWLGGGVGTGASDEAGGADYKPRDAALRDPRGTSRKQLDGAKAGFTGDRRDATFRRSTRRWPASCR